VAIITSNFWPERTGTSQTVGEFSKFLADHGIQVRVATALPYYPEWRIWDGYRGRLWCTDRDGGMVVLRSWHFVSPAPSTLTRLLHELTLSVLGAPRMVQAIWRADSVYIVSPDLVYAFTGMVLATVARRRRVLIVKDVMPDAAVELGMLRNPLAIGLSRWMARCLYRWADEIHTLGEGMRRRIAREVEPAGKIRIVPDTIDAAELAPVPYDANEFRRRFVPAGTFAVLHTGNMGKKQDLELLLRAARCMRHDAGVRFYVFGDGAARQQFLRLRDSWCLNNVSHHPLQDRLMLRHMLSGADVVLVSQLPEVVDIVVPSKLLTALGAGAMIVAACAPDSETARIIDESDGGLLIPASDDHALVRAIQRVRAGEVDVAGHRRRAREFALERFDRRVVYGPLVQEYLAA
jgi:putative colanic acid biosynthesis glycosyltransferase WcaI